MDNQFLNILFTFFWQHYFVTYWRQDLGIQPKLARRSQNFCFSLLNAGIIGMYGLPSLFVNDCCTTQDLFQISSLVLIKNGYMNLMIHALVSGNKEETGVSGCFICLFFLLAPCTISKVIRPSPISGEFYGEFDIFFSLWDLTLYFFGFFCQKHIFKTSMV